LPARPPIPAVRSARFVSRLTNGGKSLARARRHGLPVCLSTTVEFFLAIARGRVRRRNQPRNWRYGLVASRIQKRENSRRNKTDAAFTTAPVPLASFEQRYASLKKRKTEKKEKGERGNTGARARERERERRATCCAINFFLFLSFFFPPSTAKHTRTLARTERISEDNKNLTIDRAGRSDLSQLDRDTDGRQ